MTDPLDADVHVAFATDRNYLPWCAVAIDSCVAAMGARVHVHMLDGGDLSISERDRLASMVARLGAALTFHAVDQERIAVMPSKGRGAGERISWYRTLLPEMLPSLDRVIYLDADTFAVHSLLPLWTMSLDDAPVAAVTNVVEPALRPRLARLGFADTRRYFNAGVLVMNLAQMRTEHTYDAIVACIAEHGSDLAWFDQDTLNIVFAGRWIALPPRWNAQNSLWYWTERAAEAFGADAVRDACSDPAVLHFEGPAFVKPWHYLSDHPYRDQYLAALAATPWCEQPLAGRNPVTRAIRLLPRERRLPAYGRLARLRARVEARAARG